jgi:tetratricopeptide (TPR) repeat protein
MGPGPQCIKPIVAALLAAVGFSAPLPAQDLSAPEGPAVEQQDPSSPDAREADLLRQLREAEDPGAAALIETELRGLWSRSGSAAVDLLWRRGMDALEGGAPDRAVEHFTAAIDWAPDFAEAYVGRAGAYYLTNRPGPALDDLRQALVLNPDHWEALGGFAVLLEEMGRAEDALEVWTRVHDMHPQNPEAQAAVDRLRLELEGRAI